jgi:N-methylhydantoinase A/oxoprolinase/acetone carboxylase beta subunit
VLGRMDPEHFLGGDLTIDPSLSAKAIEKHIAKPLGISVEQAALGVLKIINNNMALAINANSVAKGVDPRNFTLMGFGGAGPLHSVSLAEAIYAKDVISPVHPGITAATGLLVTDLQYEYTHSALMIVDKASDDDFARVNAVLEDLTARAHKQLDADRIPKAQRRFRQIAECRYVGQGFELRAEIPEGRLTRESATVVVDHFYDAHKQVYGHAFRDQSCEIVTLRVVATVAVDTLTLPKLKPGGRKNPKDAVLHTRRTVFDDGASLDTPRYQRDKLLADDIVEGPALIIQHNSTTLVPLRWTARVIAHGDILISKTEATH